MTPPLVVVMGVVGSGKSTVGRRLADRLGVAFVDADDLHDPADVEAMRRGVPLDDDRRQPWLDRVHAELVARRHQGAVLACSALRTAYRERLRRDLPNLVHLALTVPPEVLRRRLGERRDHFAGPSLLEGQLATLELGDDVVTIDAARPVDQVVDDALAALRGQQP